MDHANPLLLLALVLGVGVVSGALARRIHFPSVTGQVLAGVALGPTIGLFGHDTAVALAPVTNFALGLMAVAVGSHLHLRRLRNARRRLGWQVLLEATITPALVFAVVLLFPGGSWEFAILLAAIAVSTAPATILALVKEGRAKGVFVTTLVAAVALNNMAAICLFELAHAAVGVTLDTSVGHGLFDVVAAPLLTIVFSAGLGGAVGVGLILATRRVVRTDRLTALSMIAILLTAGLAAQLEGVSTLLACLSLGFVLANLTPEKEEIGHDVFENFETAIFAVFFTLAGMELSFEYLVPGGLLALAVFGARLVGKFAASGAAMRLGGATDRLRRYLGLALVPQAGLAVGLMLLVTEDPLFSPMRDLMLAVVLTVVTLNEIVGPFLTRHALRASGEQGKDRAHLIDFLHESNIDTELHARTKEEAVERLVDLLIRTHDEPIDREAFLASVLEREQEASTCLGDGLSIPHGDIDAGDTLLGVMGISAEGLELPTPDGQPVHCMILLASPPAARMHHLEVLAAFARALGHDRGVRQQLFHAHSPAHAYELLHAEEHDEDFTHFLEDA